MEASQRDPPEPEKARRIPRIERPRRVIGFLVGCSVLVVLAFLLGTLVRAPSASLQDAEESAMPVFAPVEIREVSTGLVVQGSVIAGTELEVAAPSRSADRLVVTGTGVASGTALGASPTLLTVVSERPLFVVRTIIPLYRSLALRDSGADVSALQSALGVSETGVVDQATLKAVRALYASVGFAPAGGTRDTYIDASEFFAVPPTSLEATVVTVAPVGTILSDEVVAATLRVAPPSVTCRVGVVDVEELSIGTTVSVQTSDGGTIPATVTSVSDFSASTNTVTAGHDVAIQFEELPSEVESLVGQSVSVRLEAASPATLAVPLIALRQDNVGTFVLRRVEQDETERVDVIVTVQGNGYAGLTSKSLKVNDEVLVSK